MANYKVKVWSDKEQTNITLKESDSFRTAFDQWKNEFLYGKHNYTVYIEENGRSIFNGYITIDAEEPILEFAKACKVLNIIG